MPFGQQTPGQARVIDPIITEVARGYRSRSAAVANVLFPIVTVSQRGGRIIAFGPDDFKLIGTARAPGAGTKRVQFGYASAPFSLVDHSLEGVVPIELMQEAQAVPGIDLQQSAIQRVQNMMALERENQAATIARNAANYSNSNKATLTSTDQWSHLSSDPFTAIMDAKEAVRAKIGMEPNTLTLGPKALTALRTNPKVLDRMSTAADRPPATLAQLQALFEIDQIIKGDAIYHDGTAFADVWGKDAILAYTTPASLQEMGSPSYGYTYQLRDMPLVEEGYFERNNKSWIYPYTDAYQPVLVGASAGFLFKDAVA